jgi:hypothetical protein
MMESLGSSETLVTPTELQGRKLPRVPEPKFLAPLSNHQGRPRTSLKTVFVFSVKFVENRHGRTEGGGGGK